MELLSPAKINLYLKVTGKREDGYHEQIMLMSAISLYDKIRIETDKNEYSLVCLHTDVPENESNIALRAAILFRDRFGSGRPVSIHLEKNIPVGTGLGGGSSNAATVLDRKSTRLNSSHNSESRMPSSA
jgi:4-diphosphocytidyl-2-C-methyl-D-erythritol kinase